MIWFDPEKVNNPKCKAAYANGAFMMMSRKAYQKIGGHTAVKTELNEDICMARLAKDGGLKLFVIQNDGLYLTRMYASFKEAWRGWSRIFFGTFRTYRRLFATLGLVLSMSVFPFISLIVAITGLMLADEAARSHWWIALGVTGAVVLMLRDCHLSIHAIGSSRKLGLDHVLFRRAVGRGMLVMAIRKAAGSFDNLARYDVSKRSINQASRSAGRCTFRISDGRGRRIATCDRCLRTFSGV
ncbi:MAG: glycosyltransferase [Phycisphaerae bacterium]